MDHLYRNFFTPDAAVAPGEVERVTAALVKLADLYGLDDKNTSRGALRPLMLTSGEWDAEDHRVWARYTREFVTVFDSELRIGSDTAGVADGFVSLRVSGE